MLLLALAAQLSAPEPTNRRSWFTPDDVPTSGLTDNRPERVHFRLTVQPDGKLQQCEVEASTGNKRVDALTCKLLERRARFRPARDQNDRPAYGVYRGYTHWVILTGAIPVPAIGDVEVMVNKLPPSATPPALVKLQVGADEQGQLTSCSEYSENEVPALVQLACDQVLKIYRARPALTRQGIPVASVQTVSVLFDAN